MQVMEQHRFGKKPVESVATVPYKRHTLSPCLAEDEEDEKTDRVALDKGQALPWHHAQLYRLYGDKANYFLYPKIEPKPQKQLHPKLRNPGGKHFVIKDWTFWIVMHQITSPEMTLLF